jgi:murein DD-endopeptidase MepM/ murein hydrolase activator NlpD
MYLRVQRPAAPAFRARTAGRRPSPQVARLASSGAVPLWWSNLGRPGLGSTLTYPLSGSLITSSGFGTRDPLFNSTNHAGIDYAVPVGTAVLAAGDGVVTFAGVQSGYGNVVQIDNGGGISTLYAHLSSFNVSPGDTVSDGQVIAASGATGNVTGPHLHFGVYVNGVAVDPTLYLTDASGGGSFDLIPGLDLGAAGADLNAAFAAPDLSTAAGIVGNDPVLLGAAALVGGLVLWSIFS